MEVKKVILPFILFASNFCSCTAFAQDEVLDSVITTVITHKSSTIITETTEFYEDSEYYYNYEEVEFGTTDLEPSVPVNTNEIKIVQSQSVMVGTDLSKKPDSVSVATYNIPSDSSGNNFFNTENNQSFFIAVVAGILVTFIGFIFNSIRLYLKKIILSK